MKKEFTVPPVVFPSSTTTTATNLHHRRLLTPPFPPSSIPFKSFDTGAAYAASTATVTTTATLFSGEPSLLEELEIDPSLIYRKTLSILNPLRVNSSVHDPPDLSGPLLYYASFSLFQALAGKVQFGVLLGWIVLFSMSLYVLFHMLEGKHGNLDLYRCCSLVGYSMLPVLIFSAVSLFVPKGGALRFALGAAFVLWSTRVCARLLVERASGGGREVFKLIGYPCLLVYTVFAMLVLF